MSYAFPSDLARQVIDRWTTFVSRHDSPAPPLPAPRHLAHILETAFFASFEREEGRELRFVLCCAPSIDIKRDGVREVVPVVPLQVPRPLSIESLRSIAPAVSPTNAAIMVRCPVEDAEGECEIAGVVNVGSNLARARSGRSFYHRPAPYALVIDVRDAGELHIYRGGIKLAALKGGNLHDQLAFSGLEFLPISDLLALGSEALRGRIRAPTGEIERDTSDFEWTALLNTILCIVNGVKEHEHGGIVLLVAPEAEQTLPIRMKFDVDDRTNLLADKFVDFINSRHQLAGVRLRRQAGTEGAESANGAEVQSHLQNAAFVAEEDLADAADLVARLTGVDGALVLRSDLRLLGFGAEIVLDAAAPSIAYEAVGNLHRGAALPAVDSESFGMRHRSALRCVTKAERTAAFVVSQDGAVTFIWKQDSRVLLKRNVNTANPNMVGA